MKALVASNLGPQSKFTIENRPIPEFKTGYTLVRMHAATINPLSHLVRSGAIPTAVDRIVLSNDGSGVVHQSEVFRAGTRVAIYGGGQLGITKDGLQQQWVLVENKRLVELPASVTLDQGAAIPINYVTAYQALMRLGELQLGQTILVTGASGALGGALLQIASAMGAHTIGTVSVTSKVTFAKRAKARQVIDLSLQDLQAEVLAEVLAATNGSGVDLVFDTVGGAMLGRAVRAVRTRGTVISIGFIAGIEAMLDVPDLVVNEKKILGYDAWLETDEDVSHALSAIFQYADQGLLAPEIDSAFTLDEHDRAYEHLTSRTSVGTILMHLNHD